MTDPGKSLGDTIAEARETKGLTQEELALQLQTDRSVVGRWERGESVPRRRTRLAIAEILNVPVATLENAAKATNAPAELASGDEPTAGRGVLMSDRDYGYLCGTLDTLERLVGGVGLQVTASASTISAASATVAAVGDQLHSLRGLVDQFTNASASAAAFVRDRSTPPQPPPPPTPDGDPSEHGREIRDDLARRLADREARDAATRRAANGDVG